ncbi:MAG: LuxR C-terminal-related transcriptional regulator [Thiomicrorhabdus sp.]|nr:LuxR C-terminal-related transcriptional regulator [Thiomicrorhabdus sp.]
MSRLNETHRQNAMSIIELCLHANSMVEFEAILHRTKMLIEHEMFACGVGIRKDYSMQSISSLNESFPSDFMSTIVDHTGQVISPLFLRWLETQTPQVLDIEHARNQFTTEQIDFYQKFNIQNVISHGVLDCGEYCTSYFGFANIKNGIQDHHVHLIKMLVPHLHSAYTKMPSVQKTLSSLTSKQLKIKKSNNQESTLSDREVEVLQWVFIGKSNQEIGDALCISRSTIKNHLQNIIQKLNANNRQHAAAKALQRGIIKLE